MSVVSAIRKATIEAVQSLYQQEVGEQDIAINVTKPEFEGEYTIVVFPFVKMSRRKPEETGADLGEALLKVAPGLISGYNVVKGFLNLNIADAYWTKFAQTSFLNPQVGQKPANGKKVMVEYSSPNTNKPLHLGHLRNNFLGYSVAEILKANGNEVVKANLVNDRGIHICKSMLAWQMFAHGDTPASTGIKGDHLVGDYYVKFEAVLRDQAETVKTRIFAGDFQDFQGEDLVKIEKLTTAFHKLEEELQQAGTNNITDETEKKKVDKEIAKLKEKIAKAKDDINEMARNRTEIMQQAKIMLQQWEAGNPEVRSLWATMNQWVYDGFEETYKSMGVDFDKFYYESDTYLLGKDLVEEGLAKGVLFKKEDNSVWIDLTADGLDQKLLLRGDGTSVYMTQDLGTARLKYEDYKIDQSVYVVADEQNYHFKVLQLILQKLQEPCADGIFHLSYGMVELPHGKMKSREGTVVDADDLIQEMINTAKQATQELGKVKDFAEDELDQLYYTLGVGAMKFFLLRVNPKNRIIFDPSESIDLHGFTAPFIQYSYARIRSILKDFSAADIEALNAFEYKGSLLPLEKELIILCEQFGGIIDEAAREMSPATIANYAYNLAQTFNSFYAKKEEGKYVYAVQNAEDKEKQALRIQIASLTANTIAQAMKLLGIGVPNRM
ncbi:arginyl-tRNA synthetase [Chitinophaga skermanii]|uniref:Arginine--tRNA ligase n=1 Tax=Chitinophaga skermanii TaxID=331697 RepID=A0A327QM15_9BACT|nr:arginine--tRNA ligase [Chitinophaga skermanii]RAJ05068.1 arginyl-tRNA synthetase [Chitinophaga skermanii]